MAEELAYVLITPYTIGKSRTGGVIGRIIGRTGLDLVAARMFGPSRKLVEEYLKAARPDKWRALQQSASELYQEWAKEFPKTKERWQEEARYHISFLKRASFATM